MFVLTQEQLESERMSLISRLRWPNESFGDAVFKNEMMTLRHRVDLETKHRLHQLACECEDSYEGVPRVGLGFTGELIKRYQEQIKEAEINCHVRLRSPVTEPAHLSFNPETGTGSLRNEPFRFTGESPARSLFALAYARRGKMLTKAQVIEALGIKRSGKVEPLSALERVRRGGEEIKESALVKGKINEAAKAVRKKTGLTKDEFVQNAGTVTLAL